MLSVISLKLFETDESEIYPKVPYVLLPSVSILRLKTGVYEPKTQHSPKIVSWARYL